MPVKCYLYIDYDEERAWIEKTVIEGIAYEIIPLDMDAAEILTVMLDRHGDKWFNDAIKEHFKSHRLGKNRKVKS